MTELIILVRKWSHIKAKLTRFSKFLESFGNDPAKFKEIPLRLSKIDLIWNEFVDLQSQMELLYAKKEKKYICEEAQGKLDQVNSSTSNSQALQITGDASISSKSNKRKCKLPTIEVPKFDGAFDKWLTFKDTFQSMVH